MRIELDSRFDKRDYPVVTMAPANFFFGGEHSVMFGELAVCQAIPKYVGVAVRRIPGKRVVVANALYPDPAAPDRAPRDERSSFGSVQSCQLEKLCWTHGIEGVEISVFSTVPRGCGLATSGSFGAALAVACKLLVSNRDERQGLMAMLDEISKPSRSLKHLTDREDFATVWPLAWKVDALFHAHSSSGANAFVAFVGAPAGAPVIYQGARRRGDYVEPRRRESDEIRPLTAYADDGHHCKWRGSSHCADRADKARCPDWAYHYRLYDELPIRAREMSEEEPLFDLTSLQLAVALCFSGYPKRTGEVIRKVQEKQRSLARMRGEEGYSSAFDIYVRALGAACEELLNHLLLPARARTNGGVPQLQTITFDSIRAIQSKLRHDMNVSSPEIDQIVHAADSEGIAAKLTGAGRGGDVLVVGKSKPQLEQFFAGLKIPREHGQYEPPLHLRPSCIAAGELRTEPVCVVHAEPRYVLFHYDIAHETRRPEPRAELAEHLRHESDLLCGQFGGLKLRPHEGDDGLFSFCNADDAVQFAERLNNRRAEIPDSYVRFGIASGRTQYTLPIQEETDQEDLGVVATIQKAADPNTLLVCEETHASLTPALRSRFQPVLRSIGEISCFLMRW